MEQHVHPQNPDAVVVGRRLQAGEEIQADDVYASESEKWEKSPCPGLVLQKDCTTYWVRKIGFEKK